MNNDDRNNQETGNEKGNLLFIRDVLLKTLILFIVFNAVFAAFDMEPGLGKFSLYHRIIPGRSRFPFGEKPRESFNLSLYNVNAMIASHELAAEKQEDELRIFIIGDSATWGTLLKPEETIAGQLNRLELHDETGKRLIFYNLGYPSLSLTKDLMFLSKTKEYQPDMILWLLTLEAFPKSEQLSSPVVSNNLDLIRSVYREYSLEMPANSKEIKETGIWHKSIIAKRRSLADIIRLQFYGFLWAATGIDQYYPDTYEAAQRDLSNETDYYEIKYPELRIDDLSLDVITSAVDNTDIPIVIINEPILISSGRNSDIRYNFYYPRWVYDEYREILEDSAKQNDWLYYDYWDIIPEDEFTNTAIHMTPDGVSIFTEQIREDLFTGIE